MQIKSPKAKKVEVELTPVFDQNQAAKLRMMNNYTTKFIPNILKNSETSEMEAMESIKISKAPEFYPKKRRDTSTLRDHFSSGEYSSNMNRIKANFQIKGAGNKLATRPNHNKSSLVAPGPIFDTLNRLDLGSPKQTKNRMASLISDNALDQIQRKIADEYKPNFTYNL